AQTADVRGVATNRSPSRIADSRGEQMGCAWTSGTRLRGSTPGSATGWSAPSARTTGGGWARWGSAAAPTHHRRRLRRVGWDGALDAPPGFTAPRAFGHSTGNAVEVIVDGSAALPRIAEWIRGRRRPLHLAGW